MLRHAARALAPTSLTRPKTEIEWLTCNATIESFWTHARCLMEFFSRRKNQDFTASAASAMDFTEGFYPSSEMEKNGAGKARRNNQRTGQPRRVLQEG
jgi:hypothetical protein